MKRLLDKLLAPLFAPVDAATLGAFRILFGALMTYESLRYFQYDAIGKTYLEPPLLFTYEALPFVTPWPGVGLYVHFGVMAAAAAGLMLGVYYRASAFVFLATYLYVFLLDKAQYNNHYYLIVLLAALFLVVDAHRWMSIDQWRRPRAEVVPRWNLLIFRAQIFLVFVYAGVAKLNPDWLACEPMRTWLASEVETPVIGAWLASHAAGCAFSYGGMLFDLAVGFLLFSRRTLPFALAGLLVFNLTNHWLFSIGVFPFLMLATALLFAPPDLPRRMLAAAGVGRAAPGSPATLRGGDERPHSRSAVLVLLGLYLAVQVLVPLRHFLYDGPVSWHEEGHRFAWHMKLRSKHGWVRFVVTDPQTGESWKVDPAHDLNRRQRRKMSGTPDMIVQYAHYLRDEFRRRGVADPIVRADTWLSLNRRPPQPLVDPQVDLAKAPIELFTSVDWVVPLDENARPGTISVAEFGRLALATAE